MVELEAAFLVVREGDPADWLARLEQSGGFPAREGAHNTATNYNLRLELGVWLRLRLRFAEYPNDEYDKPKPKG